MTDATPGPWKIEHDYAPIVIRAQYDIICTITGTALANAKKAEANARLIAAAPDILDLARNVGGFDDALLKSTDINVIRAAMIEWRDQARAAIAKAEGK